MNKEFIEKIEEEVNKVNILDKDPFVEESCKNVYRALLVVAENENLTINDISTILNDTNKTIDLLEKFDSLNKEKYNGDLSYIFIDINNKQTLLYLIELLRQSIHYNEEADDKKTTNDIKIDKNININMINKILISVFLTSQRTNIEKIDSIKFLPSKVGYTIEVKDNHNKLYYMGVDEYGYVEIVREYSLDGKIIYVPDDDYIPPTINNTDGGNNSLKKIKNFFSLDLKNDKEITKFAKVHGYKGAKYIGKWKEYKVFEPFMNDNEVLYTGLPLVILVNDKGEIRMSTSDEAMATLDDKSFIKSYEENKNNEELIFSTRQEAVDAYIKKFGDFPFMSLRGIPDEIIIDKVKTALTNNKEISIDFKDDLDDNKKKSDINNLINNIDNKINELQIEKDKIDKEIANNFDEVCKYSILNKTLEELLSAKRKFINDWDVMLFNTMSEHWIMNSATYRVHISSIIDAILRRIDDDQSKQQKILLDEITSSFSNKDRDSAIKIVKKLKEIELK